jgi:tRNA G18 (ribose-2'-O)-methylase SpoU
MPLVRIAGPDDPDVAEYRDVADHDRLRQRGLFVAEGRLVVERLIRDGRFAVRSLLLSETACRALEPALAQLGQTVPVFLCETQDFEPLTGYNIHRGCLALASRPCPLSLEALLAGTRSLLVLEDVANADNVGGIFRNAAAFGVDGIVLSRGCADPLYRKSIRTSMAATLRVPFSVAADAEGWRAALARLRAHGFQLVALTLGDSAQDLDSFAATAPRERIAVLLGSEDAGLTPEAVAAADARVRIAIRRDVDSLNVAVAAGIALHRLLAAPADQRKRDSTGGEKSGNTAD